MSRFQRKPLPESRNPRASAYAAADFAVDAVGRWVFLESNSAGQYFWLEAHTGAPITAALTDLLAQGQCR